MTDQRFTAACHAMSGMLANPTELGSGGNWANNCTMAQVATDAIRYADALLAALSSPEQGQYGGFDSEIAYERAIRAAAEDCELLAQQKLASVHKEVASLKEQVDERDQKFTRHVQDFNALSVVLRDTREQLERAKAREATANQLLDWLDAATPDEHGNCFLIPAKYIISLRDSRAAAGSGA